MFATKFRVDQSIFTNDYIIWKQGYLNDVDCSQMLNAHLIDAPIALGTVRGMGVHAAPIYGPLSTCY